MYGWLNDLNFGLVPSPFLVDDDFIQILLGVDEMLQWNSQLFRGVSEIVRIEFEACLFVLPDLFL